MAKKIKSVEEEPLQSESIELINENTTIYGGVTELNNLDSEREIHDEILRIKPTYIPDIPAQMIEPIKEDLSVPEQPKGETEIEFLRRILHKQHEGGFGRQLDDMINDRIKSLS